MILFLFPDPCNYFEISSQFLLIVLLLMKKYQWKMDSDHQWQSEPQLVGQTLHSATHLTIIVFMWYQYCVKHGTTVLVK